MLVLDQLRSNDRHLRLFAGGILLGMALLVVSLWYVQVVAAKHYQTNLEKQSYRIVRVPAVRGKVLDRNGIPLADNRPCFNVSLYLEEYSQRFREAYRRFKEENAHLSAPEKLLAQGHVRYSVISQVALRVGYAVGRPFQVEEAEFEKHFTTQPALPLRLFRDLTMTNVARFVEQASHFPAVALEIQPLRTYPYGSLAAHVLGHLKTENRPDDEEMEYSFSYFLQDYKGVKGIEGMLDEELRGKAGIKSILVNNLSYREGEEILLEPEPGQNVVLTLDLPIQQAAERVFRSAGTNTRGAAIVMDVHTGDLLAVVSAPAFDPNLFLAPLSMSDWNALNDETAKPMLNRATLGAYPPGSVFKIVDALACLEAGIDENEEYLSKGFFQIRGRGRAWRDTAGPGPFAFKKAFYCSSNPYFQEMGLRIGPEKIVEMGHQFGLGQPTGLKFFPERSGYFPPPGKLRKRTGGRWMDGDTANLCIGQGEIEVTPLQVAVLLAAIANGGNVLEPRLVLEIGPQEPKGAEPTFRAPAPVIRSALKVSPRTMNVLRDAMLADVDYPNGTGRRAAVPGLKIYGKTGTAQDEPHKTVWFASFAELEGQPRWAVVVVVEGGDFGGTTCAPMAKGIYQELLKQAQQRRATSPSLARNS